MAPLAVRNLAHGNDERQRSMVVESILWSWFLNRKRCLRVWSRHRSKRAWNNASKIPASRRLLAPASV